MLIKNQFTFNKLNVKKMQNSNNAEAVNKAANEQNHTNESTITNLMKDFETNKISAKDLKNSLTQMGATNIEESGTIDMDGNWSTTITFKYNGKDYTVTAQGKGKSSAEKRKDILESQTESDYIAWRSQHRTYEDLSTITPLQPISVIPTTNENLETPLETYLSDYENATYNIGTFATSEFINDYRNAQSIINPPTNTYTSLDYLKDCGFSNEEISKYFEEKSFMIKRDPDGFSLGTNKMLKSYFVKDGININGQNVTTIKELMVALNKTNYFDNWITQLVNNFANGDSDLALPLNQKANEFLQTWNGDVAQFSTELGQYLKTIVEDLHSYHGDYSNYKFTSPADFINEFKKGEMSFNDAIDILTKAGAIITDKSNNQWDGSLASEIDYLDLIHFELNGIQYSAMRYNEVTEVSKANNLSDELQNYAKQFINGSFTIAQMTEKLKDIGADNITSVQFSRYKTTGNWNDFTRQIAFTLNGKNYKITSFVAESKKK